MAKVKYFFWFGVKVYLAWTLWSFLFEAADMLGISKVKDVFTAFRSAPINTLKNLQTILSQ